AARHVADEAPGQAARAAFVEGLFDRLFEVRMNLEALAPKLPAFAVVADAERVTEWRQQLAPDRLLRFGGVHAPHVDAADRHPVGDLVTLRVIVGVGAHRTEHDDYDPYGDRDFRLATQRTPLEVASASTGTS